MKQANTIYLQIRRFATRNGIGAEGVKAIGETLKTNKSLTELDIEFTWNKQIWFIYRSDGLPQGMELETKELKPLEKYWKQTHCLLSFTLILTRFTNTDAFTSHYPFFSCFAKSNKIGPEGSKAISEGLKTNTSLTELNLELTQNTHFQLLR